MRDIRTATGHRALPPRSGSRQPGSSLAAGQPSELLVDVNPADERIKVTGQAVPINQP
jgi:hypothetical protein